MIMDSHNLMTENSTLIRADEVAASPLPAFLTGYAPTR
jgi:hypothetical protein